MASLASKHKNLSVKAVLTLHRFDFVHAIASSGEPKLYGEVRRVAQEAYSKICMSASATQLYGPFGFADTGGLVVLSTNCPDNSLPFIHFQCETWNALFPRASRL